VRPLLGFGSVRCLGSRRGLPPVPQLLTVPDVSRSVCCSFVGYRPALHAVIGCNTRNCAPDSCSQWWAGLGMNRPWYLRDRCHQGQFPADEALDIKPWTFRRACAACRPR
jgi:hypothetical protein